MAIDIRTGAPSDGRARLADILTLPALEGARVVPADASLDVHIGCVALDDPAAPTEVDALLVTAGPPPEAAPPGCVAVVSRTAPSGEPGVPVVVLPRTAPWGAVIAALCAAVAEGSEAISSAAARRAFRAPLMEGRGYQGLAAAAYELLGAPVALLDEYLDTRAASGLSDAQYGFLDEAVVRARGHGPASVMGPFVEDDLPGVTRRPITGADGVIGVLVAWVPSPATPAAQGVLEELIEGCAIERAREEVRTETESRLRGDLIEELMAGEVVSRESLVRRARHLGADLSGGAVALIGKLHDPHTEGRVITDPRLVRRFLQQARAAMDIHWPRALVDWDDGRLLALLPPTPSASGEATAEEMGELALTLARRLLGATRETVPGLALTLALSRYTPEPERLGVALDEARLALSIGERLGRVGEVVTFEETGTYKLLFQIFADRPQELLAFYESTIAPLVRYDEQYQTELVATLATYLGHDCNLAATASTLFTHRHTVRYRLDRIAELSGLDIAKTDDREKLSLGLKSMRLLGRRVAPVAERTTARRRAG